MYGPARRFSSDERNKSRNHRSCRGIERYVRRGRADGRAGDDGARECRASVFVHGECIPRGMHEKGLCAGGGYLRSNGVQLPTLLINPPPRRPRAARRPSSLASILNPIVVRLSARDTCEGYSPPARTPASLHPPLPVPAVLPNLGRRFVCARKSFRARSLSAVLDIVAHDIASPICSIQFLFLFDFRGRDVYMYNN